MSPRPVFLDQHEWWSRTRRESLSRAHYASPITRYSSGSDFARYAGTPGRIRGWLLAVAIGLGLALATVHWWTT